jgi:cytoskeletal protein RodZ
MTISLGRQLKSIRESRGISLEEIAQKTHIRLKYLEAIETGDETLLSPGPQRRGFLRLYASELGVEIEGSSIKEYEENQASFAEASLTTQPEFENKPKSAGEETPVDRLQPEEPEIPRMEPDQRISKQGTPKPIKHPPDSARSSEIFSDLGDTLRQRRDLLSLSIEDIHEHIHIRKKFLTAMEKGDFNQLPSPVHARGMLLNYADFLDLNIDEILLRYADGLQAQRLEKTDAPPSQNPENASTLSKTRLKLRNFFSLDLLVIGALIIGFAVFVIWGVNRILSVNTAGVSSTELPEVADILLATGSPTPEELVTQDEQAVDQEQTGTAAPEEATPIFTPFPNNNPINIVIIPRQRAWVRVIADGEIAFEGRMLPGDAYDYSGKETLEILTGSAGALQVYFNEQDIGAPGLVGQVVNLIFTEDGLILPTPTNTPTITQTPEASLTPSPTPTATQTLQPTLTPTSTND